MAIRKKVNFTPCMDVQNIQGFTDCYEGVYYVQWYTQCTMVYRVYNDMYMVYNCIVYNCIESVQLKGVTMV